MQDAVNCLAKPTMLLAELPPVVLQRLEERDRQVISLRQVLSALQVREGGGGCRAEIHAPGAECHAGQKAGVLLAAVLGAHTVSFL